MDAGGLAQMSSLNLSSASGLNVPSSNLASRRGSQGIKPLSFDAIKQNANANPRDAGVATPRTSRSHLLAGLRTAPKSASAATFAPKSSAPAAVAQQYARNGMPSTDGYAVDPNMAYNGPQTAFPQFGVQGHQAGAYHNLQGQQQYTVDQVLAPPEIPMDEQLQDPNLYAQLVATNMYLAQQQQRLQQQLRSVQTAAQQFQQLNLNSPHVSQQQQMAIFEQQQQLRNLQQQLGVQAAMGQGKQVFYSPVTGQYYVDSSAAVAQMSPRFQEQPMSPAMTGFHQRQQSYSQGQQGTPRVQVSPPPENQQKSRLRSNSPPKRYDAPTDVMPLPPPSANAFRRGHKKASSLAPVNSSSISQGSVSDVPKSAGPKTASFPLTPLAGGYGPGQARAGEHPIRQPRGPPSLDELKAKPTAKFEGSKNFASRTRRSAVHNLVRAGMERRKGAGSSPGSMSPVSETAEDSTSPTSDNESDSGHSGLGSLVGEMECNSSRTSASGGWGAIGSDRPCSAQRAQSSGDVANLHGIAGIPSECDGSFADVLQNGALRAPLAQEGTDSQRRPAKLVLTSHDKRKSAPSL
ncbi:hypothetical protein CDD81_2023 [Ophiocordyceps australis]|uniref:Uncharacterized protein n=1 Tax=Ophiocordyceps australis TaxID=1399860 RepID=A0A2C5XKB4_9HYPO|nr:hypothetical protein CDD81_2023 [Ophiocordyceps australis]